MEDIQEILEDFLVEAFEMIEQLDQNLVELETTPRRFGITKQNI